MQKDNTETQAEEITKQRQVTLMNIFNSFKRNFMYGCAIRLALRIIAERNILKIMYVLL